MNQPNARQKTVLRHLSQVSRLRGRWRPAPSIEKEVLDRCIAEGWVQEGNGNGTYDLTDAGRHLLEKKRP